MNDAFPENAILRRGKQARTISYLDWKHMGVAISPEKKDLYFRVTCTYP